MAPIEIRFGFALDRPITIQPGRKIAGRVSGKINTESGSRRIRISLSCSRDDKSGSVTAEILGVEPRLKIGPIALMERRTVLNQDTITVKKGKVGLIPLPPEAFGHIMFVGHKSGKGNNSEH